MIIRKAVNEDIPELIRLLHQANYVHSSKRPDIFKRNITKYTPEQIEGIIANEDAPIFVAQKEDRKGEPILGYVFLQIGEFKDDEKMSDRKYAYYYRCFPEKNMLTMMMYAWMLKQEEWELERHLCSMLRITQKSADATISNSMYGS